MNKLKLQMHDLRVESFDTSPVRKGKGTVFAGQCTCPTNCTCPGCPTCDGTCGENTCNTCVQTCANYPYAQPCTYGKPQMCFE
jgi:hypothetical protein